MNIQNDEAVSTTRSQNTCDATGFTLKALGIVALIRSRMKPPDMVPIIPQTMVTPPNIISALLYKRCQ